jgi:hypothetical protein
MFTNEMQTPPQESTGEQLEFAASPSTEALKIAAARAKILTSVNSSRLTTIEERVAWLLNNYPNTRDSDITLQVKYWQRFDPEHFDGAGISILDYYRLPKLTSIARARATIQNKLKLFQASEEVRKRRKQLQDDEHANAIKKRTNFRRHAVFIDESGKNEEHLIVGSMWYLDSTETLRIYQLVTEWIESRKIDWEFHFKAITEAKLSHYIELADLLASNAAVVSFKAISVTRAGISDLREALLDLTYHLLVRGVAHEHSSGRAPLPRGIQVCKDAEETGQDKLFAADLADRLSQAAAGQFSNELYIEECSAEDSAGNIHLQLVDLFTSSLHRQLNAKGERKHAKDTFADYFLKQLGIVVGKEGSESLGDMTVHITL